MDAQAQHPPKPWLSRFGWLILIALLGWNIWIVWPRRQAEIALPYSAFLAEVKDGNVAQVKITGSEILGTFVKPVYWNGQAASPSPGGGNLPAANTSYLTFRTTFPEVVGDSSLMPLLGQHQIQVDVAPEPSPWFLILLTDGLPFLLLILVIAWMGRQAASSQFSLLSFGRSRARRVTGERTGVTFANVAGVEEAKEELQEVADFLSQPEKYHQLGAHLPRGILLVGPPGTGKTLLARAVAGQADVPFFSLSASEFVELFVGVGASRVRDLFLQAKAASPAIIYIDELDAVGRRRGSGMGTINDEREQTLNQLLVEMDGFDERQSIIILASTNRPDVLDPALLRPGRFDRQVTVGLPDRLGREGILKIHTRSLHLASNVNLGLLAKTTTGFSGADLENLCNEAALAAARAGHVQVGMVDFEEALDRIILGATRTLLLDDHERQVVAYHEAGHALIAWLTPGADPVHKVTIMPRGRALGVTEQIPDGDRYNYSQEYLLARLAVMLGGRAAEEAALGEVSTGAENDLIEATRLAKRMVARWGMGSLGVMAFTADDEQPFLGVDPAQGRGYSEETAARIDRDVQRFLTECYEKDLQQLADNRLKLDTLVHALLQDETIDQVVLARILGVRGQGVNTPSEQPVLSYGRPGLRRGSP